MVSVREIELVITLKRRMGEKTALGMTRKKIDVYLKRKKLYPKGYEKRYTKLFQGFVRANGSNGRHGVHVLRAVMGEHGVASGNVMMEWSARTVGKKTLLEN